MMLTVTHVNVLLVIVEMTVRSTLMIVRQTLVRMGDHVWTMLILTHVNVLLVIREMTVRSTLMIVRQTLVRMGDHV